MAAARPDLLAMAIERIGKCRFEPNRK